MRSTKIVSLAALLTLTGGLACKKPEPAPAPAPVDNSAAEAAAKAAAEEAARKAAAEEAARKAAAEAAAKAAAEKAAAEKAAAFKRASEAALKNIHFDFDKSDIKEGDRAVLQGIADFMKAYPNVKIQIAGNCDERGTNEYNLALGNRRASAALGYLVSLGITEDRFTTISYGKEKPTCTESNEACWSQNRNDQFTISSM